jgi:hypothetical protein
MATGNKIDMTEPLTINEVIPRLQRCMMVKLPAFLWAGPGVGKSSIINALAKSHGGICVDMRLSQMSPTDIIGIPYFDHTTNTMRFAPPSRLPSEELAKKYPLIVLFLDEMNSAPPAVQAAAYELVLDRRCGDYKLPDNVVVFAAGNRESDRGVTYRLATPLANRLLHFDLKVDYNSWLDWALEQAINSDVVAYLSTFKSSLFDFDPNSVSKSFPTPRSWEFVSKLLQTNTEANPMTDSEIRDLVGSAVGSGEATKFMNYLKVGKNLPKPADVLSGKVKEIKTREISAHYQLIISMLYEMRDYWHNNSVLLDSYAVVGNNKKVQQRKWNSDKLQENWLRMFDTFNTFIITQISLEIGIMAMRMAVSNYYFSKSTDMTKLKTWPEMCVSYFPYMKET